MALPDVLEAPFTMETVGIREEALTDSSLNTRLTSSEEMSSNAVA